MLNPFDSFKISALRIEMRPIYSIESEKDNFTKFADGKPLNEDNNKEWLDSLKTWKNEGKTIKRIRVISDELTLYEKYEFLCYYQNASAGEEILVVLRDIYESLVERDYLCDFWLFDNTTVMILNYTEKGEFLNYDLITDLNKVAHYKKTYAMLEQNTIGDYTKIVSQINNARIKLNLG